MAKICILGVSMEVTDVDNSLLHVLPDIFDNIPINDLLTEKLRFPWGEAATVEIRQLTHNAGHAHCEAWILSERRELRVIATAVHFRDGIARTFSFREFFDGVGASKRDGYYFSPASVPHPHGKGFTDLKGRYYKYSKD